MRDRLPPHHLSSYAPRAKAFHWVIAFLMALMFISIWIREETEKGSPERAFWTDTHTSLGLVVFGLTVLRLVLRTPAPPPLAPNALMAVAARAAHGALYLVTLLVPVSGFLRMAAKDRVTSFFGIGIPSPTGDAPAIYDLARSLHGEVMQYLVLALIGLHLAAALWHHFVLKDATLRRMT